MMVSSPRRFSLLGLGVVLVVWLCVTGLGVRPALDYRARARAGAIALDSLVAHAPDSVRALALAYQERARLGLGSPFRLIDQAVHDPRLGDSIGRTVGWAIVDRILEGTVYEIDASVLDGVGAAGAGAGHLALIDGEMDRADDPRIAERTIRLAYTIAASAGRISPASVPVIVEVAALRRDRALAAKDLRTEIASAQDRGTDLLDEIVAARANRSLAVELPPLATRLGDEGLDRVESLIAQVGRVDADSGSVALGNRSALPASLAPMVGQMGARLPPQPAVTLSLRAAAPSFRNDGTLLPSVREYLASSRNEESFAAAYAIANRFSDRRSISANRAALSAAVNLRVLAQEPVWFPGMPGLTPGEVVGQFGLRSIDFDHDVPFAWRRYYARMAASAIQDLQRVLPGYEPKGLAIRFVTRSLPDSALAMHDPRTHALILSIGTAPGALAHEFAHDLDWQSARRLFSGGGGYATDRSAREMTGQLGASVRWLSAARTSAGRMTSQSSRPAEVFARSSDWFITESLSRLGRSNGNLSTIQDPLLPGFAAGLNDAASLTAADALVTGLGEMTPVADSVRLSYLERWADGRSIDPVVAVARLGGAPVIRLRSRQSLESKAGFMTVGSCVMNRLRDGSPRERVLALALEARAEGLVFRRARGTSAADRLAWAHAALGEPTWSRVQYEELLGRTLDAVIDAAGHVGIGLPPAPFSAC